MVPEGVPDYPRWEGRLGSGRSFLVVAEQEVRRTWESNWALLAILLVLFFGILSLVQLQLLGERAHTMEAAVGVLDLLRWGALILAAVMAGPTFLEDDEAGALELYYSRAVTRWDYLGGKVLAVLGLTTAAMWVPILLYWGGSYLILDAHPEQWAQFPLRALVYALLWSIPVTGLGLGLSTVSGSGRAATLLLFGGFFALDVIVSNILSLLTRAREMDIISPFAAHGAQVGWLFQGMENPFEFEYVWGLVALGLLAILGWGLVWARHPKVQGVEH